MNIQIFLKRSIYKQRNKERGIKQSYLFNYNIVLNHNIMQALVKHNKIIYGNTLGYF